MNTFLIKVLASAVCFVGVQQMQAQQAEKKFSINGAARGIFYGDNLDQDVAVEDTITIPKLNSGHVLVDLGMNIRPVKNMEIQAMIRVRNDYGGFWGSGVTFDIRQMFIKGVIGNIVRYQLGDINYKMTRYTMWNYNQELSVGSPAVFSQQSDLLNYDHFYNKDNSWRQQGGAAEFALVFKSVIDELHFHAVTTRVKASDNSSVNDRLFSGLNVQLVQSKYAQFGINYVSLYDVEGTSRNNSLFSNPVLTGTVALNYAYRDLLFAADAEFGRSKTLYKNNEEAPEEEGSFFDAGIKVAQKKYGITLGAKVKRVDPDFNSPGAQTKRIDFSGYPTSYQRITNEQVLRGMSMIDLMRETSLYNMQLQAYLMDFNPSYDNITPFGDATPNRMGSVISAEWQSAKIPVKVKVEQTMMTEVRGQGTTEVKNFDRTYVEANFEKKEFLPNWKNRVAVGVSYRMDKTARPGTDFYKDVNLETNVLNAGLEVEVIKNLDIMLGIQSVEYSGFDFRARLDEYSNVFNFDEMDVDGKESMFAGGLRYRFSEKSFLSAQMSKFDRNDYTEGSTSYSINQIMLLYQMTF